jgi:hypothetical protein
MNIKKSSAHNAKKIIIKAPISKHRVAHNNKFLALHLKLAMVVASSVDSSTGSRTYDSPRKRKDYPPKDNKLGAVKQTSPSLSTSQSSSTRPPASPRPKSTQRPVTAPNGPSKRGPSPKRSPSPSPSPKRSPSPSSKRSPSLSSKRSASLSSKRSPSPSSKRSASLSSKRSPSPSPRSRSATRTAPPKQKGRSLSPAVFNRTKKTASLLPKPIAKPQIKAVPPSPKTKRTRSLSKASRGSEGSRQSGSNSQRQAFHVRVSLGYLTGIKMEQLKKKKRNLQNSLVVGYAELARSKKQIAISQPLIPNIGDDSKSKRQKLYWSKQRGGKAVVGKTKRRLHFSLNLEKETDTPEITDDESVSSQLGYLPEVVKVIIGLKCGEEKIPLGVANLVVNGNDDSLGQKIDLALRPMSEVPELDTPKQSRSVLGIFGSRKQQGVSFTNDEYSYKLQPNATLRVRLDIRAGLSGQKKKTIWGDISDDASYTTNASHTTHLTNLTRSRLPEAGFPGDRQIAPAAPQRKTGSDTKNARQPSYKQRAPAVTNRAVDGDGKSESRSFLSEWVEVLPNLNALTIAAPRGKNNSTILASEQVVHMLPVKYVAFRPLSDERSLASGLTSRSEIFNPSACWQCFPILCGDDTVSIEEGSMDMEDDDEFLSSEDEDDDDDDYEDDELSEDRPAAASHHSDAGSSVSFHNMDVRPSAQVPEANLEKEKGQTTPARDNLVVVAADLDIVSKGSSGHQGVTDDEATDDETTAEITVDTYSDLKDAQETLLRYANKLGIDMEDLLNGMDKKTIRKLGMSMQSKAPGSKASESKRSVAGSKVSVAMSSQSKLSQKSKASERKPLETIDDSKSTLSAEQESEAKTTQKPDSLVAKELQAIALETSLKFEL